MVRNVDIRQSCHEQKEDAQARVEEKLAKLNQEYQKILNMNNSMPSWRLE